MQARRLFHARTPGAAPRQHPRPGRTGHRRLGAALVAATAVGAVVATALPAAAALGHVGAGVEVSGVLTTGKAWLGAVEGTVEAQASQWLSWCTQAGYDAPSGTGAAAVDYVDDPQLAWIIGTYESVDSDLSRAAISYLVHTRHETGTASVSASARVAAFQANTPQAVKNQANAYLTEAAAQAGPYSATDGTNEYTDVQRTGAVTVHPLTSSTGTPQTGKPYTVTLDGPAVFDTNGNGVADPGETNVYTGTTQATDIRLPWAGTGNGDVVWSISYGELRRTKLTKYSSSGQVQDTLSYGNRGASDPEEITVPGPTFQVVMDFAVVGTSQVTDKVVDTGGRPGDTLHIEAAPGDEWVVVDGAPVTVPMTATAYATGTVPADEQAAVPADAVELGHVDIDATGPGDYTATIPGAGVDPGMVTWVWATRKADMPADRRDYLRADWSDAYGIAAETSSVRHEIDIDSALSIRETKSGLFLVDDAWQDGFAADHTTFTGGAGFTSDTASVIHTAYFFPAGLDVVDANLSQATELAAVTTDATNGYFPTQGATGWKVLTDESGQQLPGTYVVVSAFAGDDRTAPLTTSVTDVTEQFVVEPTPPVLPPLEITTQIRTDREVADGATIVFQDDTLVTGTVPDGGITVQNDLYAWPTADDAVCSPETLVAAGDPITVTEPGTVTSSEVTADVEGGMSYGYVETARNDTGQVVHRGECGAETETVHVAESPEVRTQAHASSDDPKVGDDIWDTIDWDGPFPDGATTSAELFFVPEGQELVCTADTSVWVSDAIAVEESPGQGDTDRYTTTRAGTYGFVETTTGPDGEVISTGTCGDSDETLTVGAGAIASAGDGGELALTGLAVGGVVGLGVLTTVTGLLLHVAARRRTAFISEG